jgi:hypothetical protein
MVLLIIDQFPCLRNFQRFLKRLFLMHNSILFILHSFDPKGSVMEIVNAGNKVTNIHTYLM